MTSKREGAMRPSRLAALALAAGAALSLAACGKDSEPAGNGERKPAADHAQGEALKLTADEAELAGVKVEPLRPQALDATVVVTASIQPDQDKLVRVAPRVEGRVTSAPAKLGDRVRAGQVLAVLDSVAVGEAHAALVQAQTELRIAEADFKRAESLVADEIIPRKDFLRAQADREKAAAAVRAQADRLRLLGGDRSAGAGTASGFAVTAPFAGTVIEKKAVLGVLASPSEPIFTIADLGRVWIQADLPEPALAKVRIGANAKVSVPAYQGETFAGRVDYLGAGLNKETRTVAARIVVLNADGRLKPEMFATAAIEVAGDMREVLSLPDAAIVLMQGKPAVFVYEQGAYETRVIETGERSGGRTVVKGGLKPGEQVVTAGAYALKARKLKSQIGHGH